MLRKAEFIYPRRPDRRSLHRLLLLAGGLCLTLLLVFFLISSIGRSRRGNLLENFQKALQKGDFHTATALYEENQREATDPGKNEEQRAPAREIQLQMEEQAGSRVLELYRQMAAGNSLSEANRESLETLGSLASMHLVPAMNSASEDFLLGKMGQEQWKELLQNLSTVKTIHPLASDLLSQEEGLAASIQLFQKADTAELGDDWEKTWSAWNAILENPQSPRFAVDYASRRLHAYQESKYDDLIGVARERMEAGEYYSAHKLLSRMHSFFPESSELNELLLTTERALPASTEIWKDSVAVLSLRPLVARPELSFARSGDPSYSASALITSGEFSRLLQTLYDEDYVLISPRQIADWPQSAAVITVPEGKKPLILLFDQYQYTVLNQLCGTASRLDLNESGQLVATAGEKTGRDLDAIPILEDFLEVHPDFSFDGGKAVLALNLNESLFGHVLNSDQVAASQKAWEQVFQSFPQMTEEELAADNAAADRLLRYLQKKGWDFASAGYTGMRLTDLGKRRLRAEIEQWEKTMAPWLPDPRMLVFPDGAHLYGDEAAMDYLFAEDYNIFFGEGPKPYYFLGKEYVHFDRLALNGNTLNQDGTPLAEILPLGSVLDATARE